MKVAFADVFRESFTLPTPDGLALEAELRLPEHPRAAAVLTHPDPTQGGNMRSMVPGLLARALPLQGVATLRFNFRGAGTSDPPSRSTDPEEPGEQIDVKAAVDRLYAIAEGLPLVLCGSSFGADTALCVADHRIAAWCAMAPPLRDAKLPMMVDAGVSDRAKLLVVAERDQFRLPQDVLRVTEHWHNTEVLTISGADHFFVGRTDQVIEACGAFVAKVAAGE